MVYSCPLGEYGARNLHLISLSRELEVRSSLCSSSLERCLRPLEAGQGPPPTRSVQAANCLKIVKGHAAPGNLTSNGLTGNLKGLVGNRHREMASALSTPWETARGQAVWSALISASYVTKCAYFIFRYPQIPGPIATPLPPHAGSLGAVPDGERWRGVARVPRGGQADG
jgi:hypothetical protein